MILEKRQGSNLNRRKLKVISQTPDEIIVDIERADNIVGGREGTRISADTLNTYFNDINSSLEALSRELGTVVKVAGVDQALVEFVSNPQTQIDSKLNVSATAADSAKLGGKTEGQLSVNHAATAGTATSCTTSVNLTGDQTLSGNKTVANGYSLRFTNGTTTRSISIDSSGNLIIS